MRRRRGRTARPAACRASPSQTMASEPMCNTHVRPRRTSVIVSPSSAARSVKRVTTGASGAMTWPKSNSAGGALATIVPFKMTITIAGINVRNSLRTVVAVFREAAVQFSAAGAAFLAQAIAFNIFFAAIPALARDRCDVRLHLRHRSRGHARARHHRPNRSAILRPRLAGTSSRSCAIAAFPASSA